MSTSPVRVLVVDDQEIFADALRLFLECDPRLEVVGVATDGAEAVDLAQLENVDVVVMDMTMPRMSGIEATKRLLSVDPDARVLLVSGSGEVEADALAAGAAGFLLKGGLTDQVVDKILEIAPPVGH